MCLVLLRLIHMVQKHLLFLFEHQSVCVRVTHVLDLSRRIVCLLVCGRRSVHGAEERAVRSARSPMMPCAVTDSAAALARCVWRQSSSVAECLFIQTF